MFSYLVESDLHKGELKRRGTFFLATLGGYAVLLLATGITGVYAYEAHIGNQNLELVALVPPEMEEVKEEPPTERPTRATTPDDSGGGSRRGGGVPEPLRSNTSPDLTKIDGPARGSTSQLPPSIPQGDGRAYIFDSGGPYNPNAKDDGNSSSSTNGKGKNIIAEEPPPVAKKTTEKPKDKVKIIGVVNSLAVSLPEPTYPPLARQAGIQGQVNVEIMIDETGRVISARATSGNPLLRQESERAAYRARFTPTWLSEQAVKAKGIITYNFVLRR